MTPSLRARLALSGVTLCTACAAAAAEEVPPLADAVIKVSVKSAESLAIAEFGRLANGNPVLGTVLSSGAAATLSGVLIAYKVQDFAVDVGLSAVGREDRALQGNLVLVHADAAVLKGLRAQGVDLSKDPRALAAKRRLTEQRNAFEATEQSPYGFAFAATGKHLPYAVAEVGGKKLVGMVVGKAFKGAAGFLQDRLPRIYGALTKNTMGDELSFMVGNRSLFASGLRYGGWSELGTRAAYVKRYTDMLVDNLVRAMLDEAVKTGVSKAFGDALDILYREVIEDNPSQPAPLRVRSRILAQPEVFAAVVMPMLAAPRAAAAVPVPVPVRAVPDRAPDPLVNQVWTENRYMDSSRRSDSDSHSSSSPASAPETRQPEPRPKPQTQPEPQTKQPPSRTPPRVSNPCRASWTGSRVAGPIC